MDPLKSFIQENKDLFREAPPAPGHEERFERRLEEQLARVKRMKRNYMIYISLAASFVLIVSIGFLSSPCPGGSNACYYNEILRLSEEIEFNSRNMPEYRRQEILMTLNTLVPEVKTNFLSPYLPACPKTNWSV
jgi:hypothetical protein